MGSFDGRVVVVTGGAGALGAAVVGRILEGGGTCVVPCRTPAEAERFAARGGVGADPRVRIDLGEGKAGIELSDEHAVERCYAGIPALWASVHVAGGFALERFADMSKQALLDQLSLNLVTAALCTREAIKRIRAGNGAEGRPDGGRIVNVAARPALEPRLGAGMVAYTASKAGLAALTQAVAEEVASEGILVNAVVPSIMDTPANRTAMPTADHSKWAKLDEVAATICFLASPENSVTRGGLVPVYGAA